MLTETDLAEYLAEIREEVCSRCVERPEGGPPCAPAGKSCGVEMHLPQLIDSIRGVHSPSIGPYLEANRSQICPLCPLLHTSNCPCPMDYLAVLLVQAVETVDARRARRERVKQLIAPLGVDKASMDEVARAYEAAAGQWTGCDWPTCFGKSGLDLRGLSSADAELRASAAPGAEEAEEWRVAATWLARWEQAAVDAEAEATLAVAEASAGHWGGAVEHARRARAIEFCTGRPIRIDSFTWEPLHEAIERTARAGGWRTLDN